MLRSTSLRAYIFRSTCFMLYAMLSMLRSSLSYVFLCLDPHASMSHIMCLWLDLSFPCVVWLDQYVSMFVHVLVAFSTCFMLYAMARSFFLMC